MGSSKIQRKPKPTRFLIKTILPVEGKCFRKCRNKTGYIYAIIKLTGNSSSQGEYLLTVKYASF
jgi:hypothetical protein